jgi:oligoendopeptidase F
MFDTLPNSPQALAAWTWPDIEPYFQELQARILSNESLEGWLANWSQLAASLDELEGRLYVATTVNTADQEAENRWENYLNTIYTSAKSADQGLKEKLLASGLEPEGFGIPLRNMRAHADLFRQENLPLLAQEQKMSNEYDKIVGAQTFKWQGQSVTIERLKALLQGPDRAERERAWRLASERQLADREAINNLWERFTSLRLQIAANAKKSDYRAYQWQGKLRFDYTPEDCKSFHTAIEQVVVPAAKRLYERRRQQLGLDTLRPWDLADGWYSRPVEPPGLPPLKPFESVTELKTKTQAIFNQVDPQLGRYFQTMIDENLLDLDNRPNKAPGGYCINFVVSQRPFVFMNAVGVHDNVQTLLHEGGHSFHDFEKAKIKYYQQMESPMEFNEVASMGMELLASPYLTKENGGFYNEAEAARARIEHLESCLLFWPFMAVVDAFQHWVYENPEQGAKPAQCDAKWAELWERFIPSVDWSGLEEAMMTGWHRKLHIHQVPFYYVEYGLAQLGAMQVWANALKDQSGAVAAYRKALALGGTVTLPELFAIAGAKFAFDASTLKQAVDLIERVIWELEAK